MNTNNMFELATRSKMRFPFRGSVSVEDLWDLSVENLDSVFKTLNSQLKKAKEESLLSTRSEADQLLDAQIEIVKYIVTVKLEEDNKRKKAKEQRELRQKLLAIKAEKQDASLKNKTEAEIDAMLAELG